VGVVARVSGMPKELSPNPVCRFDGHFQRR
jgi:hypothetical protein